MWHFSESDFDSKDLKDPTELTVQSHTEELSPLQIFGRETLQNAIDNRSASNAAGKVKVAFRLHELSGAAKQSFLAAMRFDEIESHLESARKEQLASKIKMPLPDPKDITDPKYVMKVLVIEDFGTLGLVGPECEKEKALFPDIPHCFLGLCRNVGDSQKPGATALGTHGIGKTVLWKNSRIKTVLFYSNLDKSYNEGGHEHNTRFFGQIRLPGHYLNENAYRGEGYLGNREDKLTRSLYDQAARDIIAKLGISVRDQTTKGTTVIIVDFDDPDQPDDEEKSSRTVTGLRNCAERYFWPAITAGRLEVEAGLVEPGKATAQVAAEPNLRGELSPLIRLFKTAAMKEVDADNIVKFSEIDLPKGPDKEEKGVARLAIALRLSEAEGTHAETFTKNAVALIRGVGMVIGYWHVPRKGIGAKDYYAIALGGLACPAGDKAYDQDHLEQLLSWAEPVTHDNWTQNAEVLKSWRGSRTAVREVRDAITDAISDATTTTVSPEGDAAPLLAGMFPLGGGDSANPDPRDIHIEVTEAPHALDFGSDGRPRYGFIFKITVPQRQKFRTKIKPDNWRLVCSYGYLGEGRHRKVIEHVKSRFTRLKIDEGVWKKIDGVLAADATHEEGVGTKQVIYEIEGETEPLDPNVALVAKHDLAVEVYRGYEE